MHISSNIQLNRLLDKAFIQQLFESICSIFRDLRFEIHDCQGHLFFAYAKTSTSCTLTCRSSIIVDNQKVGMVCVKKLSTSPHPAAETSTALAQLLGMLLSSFAQLQWERRCITQDSLTRYRELALLHQLGEKMGACLDPDKLAAIVLSEVRQFTRASAGSLMLICPQTGLAPAASFGFDEAAAELTTAACKLAEIVLASGKSEIIDAACHDPRLAPAACGAEPLLCVPLKIETRILGVLNLSHKTGCTCFSSEDMKLTEVVAAHAANAFETARLFTELENMAYAIILASSATIDARDACTAGHSTRVAHISLAIAENLNQLHQASEPTDGEPTPLIKLQELEYAALLHDIGKIGVPEAILTKRSRLSQDRILAIKTRFDFIAVTTGQHLTDEFALILKINQAHIISPAESLQIKALTQQTYTDLAGIAQPFVWTEEADALCIPSGNLVKHEFQQIQTHAEKSYRILRKIPFPADLRRIPYIAYQHHERLNGSGYPNGLTSEEILLESKILSVADVFEALTAVDRPYRSPVSVEKALEILGNEAEAGCLDRQIVDVLSHILRTNKRWFTTLTSTTGRNSNEW